MMMEDEAGRLKMQALYLRTDRYDRRKALGPKEGLEYIEEERFHIILLDIMMPDMDGWSVCREIRQHSDVPIITVTAREQKVDIVKGLKLGADDYITKPFNEEELVARMNALLRRAKPGNHVEMD